MFTVSPTENTLIYDIIYMTLTSSQPSTTAHCLSPVPSSLGNSIIEEVIHPCNPNPCPSNHVCQVNRKGCHDELNCQPYFCVPGRTDTLKKAMQHHSMTVSHKVCIASPQTDYLLTVCLLSLLRPQQMACNKY